MEDVIITWKLLILTRQERNANANDCTCGMLTREELSLLTQAAPHRPAQAAGDDTNPMSMGSWKTKRLSTTDAEVESLKAELREATRSGQVRETRKGRDSWCDGGCGPYSKKCPCLRLCRWLSHCRTLQEKWSVT